MKQRRSMLPRMLSALPVCLVIAGCALGPDYRRPALELPTNYPEKLETGAASPSVVPVDWWKLYGDATLNQLVADALKNSNLVKIAAAQVDEADAVLRQANAALLPEIDLGVAGSRSRATGNAAIPNAAPLVRDDRRGALSTAFEIDFWGKLRRGSESARAQALSTLYGQEVVSQSLVATVVQAYFSLRSLDTQLTALESSLKSREESLDVVRSRAAAGLVSDLDINQAEGARADLAAQIKELQRQRANLLHLFVQITLNADLQLARGDIRALPIPPVPPPGLPSALMDRRPDIRAAEQNLVAANAQIGIAKAALFPSLSLTGFYGGQSAALENLMASGSRIWSAGFGLTLPVFDAGRNLARVDQYEARQRQALFSYARTIAVAFSEVADALTNLRQSGSTEADLQARMIAARNTLELARARYESGYSPYLDVLDAQRTANDAEIALVRNRQLQLAYSVDFMKAIGGGWDPALPRAK